MQHAEMNLFLWALLLNRIEIAKIFWKLGEVSHLKCFEKKKINKKCVNLL